MAAIKKCCIHFGNDNVQRILPFTNVSWAKVIDCGDKWKSLGGVESQLTAELLQIAVDESTAIPADENFGYHRQCYSKFTDKTRILAREKKIAKNGSDKIFNTAETNYEPTATKHFMRSMSAVNKEKRNSAVLPEICIICRGEKYVLERHSSKRKKEKLSQCETNDNILLQAATQKKDEHILVHIRGKDLVAVEVRYHRSCYRNYTKFLTKSGCASNTSSYNTCYEKSFQLFCKDVIENCIIEKKEIFRMNKLTELFVKTVSNVENIDISGYRNAQLKSRIVQKYPQIRFVKQSRKNKCELVFCEVIADVCQILDLNSSATTETDDDTDCLEKPKPSLTLLRDLYSSATALRNLIANSPALSAPWPPNGSNLTTESAIKMIPVELFNFLAWCIEASEEVTLDKFVDVSANKKCKILSIAQDIIYIASNGKKQTPKHMSLAMTIRHLSGSSKLIGLLNGFGHCVSHTSVLQHDTALALKQLHSNSLLPENFHSNVFSTLVWDNNDFGEETLSGSGTTHNTNGIIIQWEENPSTSSGSVEATNIKEKKGRKRTLDANPPLIEFFHGKKKHGPPCFTKLPVLNEDEQTSVQKIPRMIDDIFYISKCFDENSSLPGWTGFNTLLESSKTLTKTKVGYLPVLDANPTEMSTLNTVLHRSIQIANQLHIDNIVIVMDQAMYAKAQQIRWQNEEFQKRLVMRLGEFHITMAFLAIIGKRFRDAGLQDILIESATIAQNSVNGVISGHHYNRSIRAHKLMAEALQRLRYQAFMQGIDITEIDEVRNYFVHILDMMEGSAACVIANENVKRHLEEYAHFIEDKNSVNPTFAFWNSYLEFIQILLLFVRATREGNWALHLTSVRLMLPWFFAYDRLNYSRYLSIYWCEMLNLKKTHPNVDIEFSAGKFVVQQQDHYGFSKTACDQVIEQTCNRDSKTKGGLTGITCLKGAVQRWVLSHHSRASILHQCEEMAGKRNFTRKRKELDSTRIIQDEKSIQVICDTVKHMMNPFDDDGSNTELVNIVTGQIARDNIRSDLENAFKFGNENFKLFLNERLTNTGSLDFFTAIKSLKLKTFSDIGKTVQIKMKEEMLALKANRNLLTRLLVIAKIQNLNLEEIMKYSLSPIPPALGNYDGSKTKTNKATLMHYLKQMSKPDIISDGLKFESNTVLIVDGMALIQQLNHQSNTFGDLALYLLNYILKLAKTFNCKRVDFVADTYPNISIKETEREKRAISGIEIIKITNSHQKLPKQMKKFLGSGENKMALIEFIFEMWKTYINLFEDITLVVAHNNLCHSIRRVSDTQVVVQSVSDLECDHEEADTRIILHAAHASHSYKNIIIKSPDTDVLVLAIAFAAEIKSSIFIMQETKDFETVNATSISNNLGSDVSKALIGLHVFTGCDSVSCFKGKGKVKAFRNMCKSRDYIMTFKELGNSWDLPVHIKANLENFTCQLYGQNTCKNIDTCRYNWLRLGCKTDVMLPPNKDCLEKHALRSNYQSGIHKRSLLSKMCVPSPTNHGWKIVNNKLQIDWQSSEPVPQHLMKRVHCKCKKTGCFNASCSCHSAAIPCTELCSCINCQNHSLPENEIDSGSDSEISEVEEAEPDV